MRLSVVVPNYNGQQLLTKYLPPLLAELAALAGATEVIIVDDASRDDSAACLRTNFPSLRLLCHSENRGFGRSANDGVAAARAPLVLLLNSDVRVLPGCLAPLLAPFAATDGADVFAVGAADVRNLAPGQSCVPAPPRFRRGFWRYHMTVLLDSDATSRIDTVPAFAVSGGWMVVDRQKFLELGGFDRLYEPFYAEDDDLCYRAWKRDWRVLAAPGARIVHEHGRGAIASHYARWRTDLIRRRNRFLFIWKNLHSRRLFGREHLLPALFRVALGLLYDPRTALPFFWALTRLRRTLAARARARAVSRLSDEAVLAKIESLWLQSTGMGSTKATEGEDRP